MVRLMMPEEEFQNPDTNYFVLMEELKTRLINIQLDLQNIRDPEVKGIAQKIYSDLKMEYFRLYKDYVAFVGMSEGLGEKQNEEVDTDGIL